MDYSPYVSHKPMMQGLHCLLEILMFNSNAFVASFDAVLLTLTNSEKITKATLQVLSRDLLSLLHTKNDKMGDIGYINRTIQVLTPVNKRAFIAFCKEFTGFILNDGGLMFDKKSKKHYDVVAIKAIEWLDDPLNNIWSWQETNLEVEKVVNPFDMDKVRLTLTQLKAKAAKNNISNIDIIGALFDTGFTVQDLIDTLEKVDKLGEAASIIEHDFAEV
jgi:hypothetical protein